MPSLTHFGLDGLAEAFANIYQIPENVQIAMLNAEAEVASRAMKTTGEAYGVRDDESTVHILDVMVKSKPNKGSDGVYLYITFKGTRTDEKHDHVRNAEIAFVNEYGRPGQAARPFVRDSLEKAEGNIYAAAENVYNEWIDKTF